MRRKLRERPERLVMVVSHAAFLEELVPEEMPYANTEWRVYAFQEGGYKEDAKLVRVEKGKESAALGVGHNTSEPERAVDDHGV